MGLSPVPNAWDRVVKDLEGWWVLPGIHPTAPAASGLPISAPLGSWLFSWTGKYTLSGCCYIIFLQQVFFFLEIFPNHSKEV